VRRPTIIFSFKKQVPVAFAIFLCLVVVTEAAIYVNRPNIITDFWNKFLINEHRLIDHNGEFKYLMVGDSIQKTGIKVKEVDDAILNLGLPGGKPMSLYLLLKRYLKTNEAPEAIFLYVDPEEAHDSLLVILRYFVSIPEFLTVFKDLTWNERSVFLMRYWASLDLRKVGLTVRDRYPYNNGHFVETMKKNHGYMPSPRDDRSLPDDFFVTTAARAQRSISVSSVDMKYLDKIMRLAESSGIQVFFIGFLAPEELLSILEATGFNAEYMAFFEDLKKRYPNAMFAEDPISFMENRYFGDMSHVNSAGSEKYTQYFENEIFKLFLRTKD
jgi:hypothetical protein